jgi:hypothetical protein
MADWQDFFPGKIGKKVDKEIRRSYKLRKKLLKLGVNPHEAMRVSTHPHISPLEWRKLCEEMHSTKFGMRATHPPASAPEASSTS